MGAEVQGEIVGGRVTQILNEQERKERDRRKEGMGRGEEE